MKFKVVLSLLLTTCCMLLTSPVYAKVEIKDVFGFGGITSLGQATNLLVTPIFSLAAAAVVIYFLFGAFKYLVSRGNKEEVAAAKDMLTHSIIGFVVLMFAFLILQYLLSSLFGISGLQLIK